MAEISTHSAKLAGFITSLQYADLPRPAIDRVKTCIFHVLACSFAGHHLPWSQAAINYLRDLKVSGQAKSFVDGLGGPAPEVSFVNSVLSHSVIQEDMHIASGCHTGTMVIPAALATGEETNCTGKELITAIMLGYELVGRIGVTVMNPAFTRLFRASSFFGPYGACAAAARLLKLTEPQVVNSLGLAGNLSMGLNEWAMEGTDDLFFQNAFASSCGIKAAMLGKRGVSASKAVIEGQAGLWAAYGKQESAPSITEGLGESFEIMKVYFKSVPACALAQTAVALAFKMTQSHQIDPNAIDSVEIRTFQIAKDYPGLDFTGPFTGMSQAKMSMAYGVAAVLCFKELNQSIYDRIDDALVSKLAARTSVVTDPDLSKNFPRQGCQINVTMKDGKVISDKQDDVRTMTDDEVVKNFGAQAGRVLGEKRAAELADGIHNLENIQQITKVTRLFIKK